MLELLFGFHPLGGSDKPLSDAEIEERNRAYSHIIEKHSQHVVLPFSHTGAQNLAFYILKLFGPIMGESSDPFQVFSPQEYWPIKELFFGLNINPLTRAWKPSETHGGDSLDNFLKIMGRQGFREFILEESRSVHPYMVIDQGAVVSKGK
jgi:hypothetical protein